MTRLGFLGGTASEWDQAYNAIEEGLTSGALNPVVGQTYSLSQAREAHVDVIEHKEGTAGKIILLPWA